MRVANAIYDVVFKYLMEDKRIAKQLLSALLKMEVEELELQPQEYTTDVKNKSLTIYRIDFKARIKLPNGESKIVLIELQKAKFPSDIMRFRKYLGEQYAHENNIIETTEGKKEALPIITIYFLGYPLEKYPDRTIIRVKRKYFDDITNKELTDGTDPFIESLTHDTIIVQVAAIKKKRHRSKLEKVLSVFDPDASHGIEINEEEYPVEYNSIIRRLTKAYVDERIRKTMDMEDEVLKDLSNAERKAQKAEQKAKQALLEKEKAKKEAKQERKEKELAQKKAEQERKEKELAQKNAEQERKNKEQAIKIAEQERKEKELAQKEVELIKQRELEIKLKLAKMLKENGKSIDEIVQETGLSTKIIRNNLFDK